MCGDVFLPTSSLFALVLQVHCAARDNPRNAPPRSDERTLSSPELVRICAVVRAQSGRQFGTTRANVEGFTVEIDLYGRLDLLLFAHCHEALPFGGDAKPLRRLREDPGFKKTATPLETCVPAGETY